MTLVSQTSLAHRCHIFDDGPENIGVNVLVNAVAINNAIAITSASGDNGEPGGHCYMGQLTYEQLQNLQGERLKAAIIRSLNTNPSWQQKYHYFLYG